MHVQTNILMSHRALPPLWVQSLQATPNYHREGVPFHIALGAAVGIQRERAGMPAGVRTHMLVALGVALFVIASLEFGMSSSDLSRVIQGVATGIGFIGAGAILKLKEAHEVEGLTTAAGIWMTAAVGMAAGLGRWGSATLSVVLTLIILSIVGQITHRIERHR